MKGGAVRFRLIDDTRVSGRSYDDIVERMAGHKLVEPRSLKSYREATASRVGEMYEKDIDSTDNRSFVRSLEAAGLLKREA